MSAGTLLGVTLEDHIQPGTAQAARVGSKPEALGAPDGGPEQAQGLDVETFDEGSVTGGDPVVPKTEFSDEDDQLIAKVFLARVRQGIRNRGRQRLADGSSTSAVSGGTQGWTASRAARQVISAARRRASS